MSDSTPFKRPINWANLRADEAERIIHERSRTTGNVIVIGHPRDRAEQRDILQPDLYRILQMGMVLDPPVRNEKGDWEAVIRRQVKGERDAAAATIILRNDDKIIVKTVMWIDP